MHRILPTLPRDEIHVLRATLLGAVSRYSIAVAFLGIAAAVAAAQSSAPAQPGYTIPLIDLANEQDRQVVVDREPGQYLGHPTTVLLEDQQTMLCVYPKGHGRGGIVMKRSTDAGRTWSDRLPTPASWATSMEVPTLHRVVDAEGVKRLIMWSGLHPARLAVSNDDGQTWSELETVGDWGGIVVMGSVVELKTGPGHYMALFHDDGRFIGPNYPHHGEKHFYVYKSISTDGGLTWGKPEVIATHPEAHLCEPGAIRSPDGNQIAVLLRENSRQFNSFVIYSNDEGATWTEPVQTTGALTGDRHTAKYTPDGRLFVSFRDTTRESSTRGDWVAWVGTYDDIRESREGQYRVRLMDNHRSADCAYPGVEVLPDGTIVTTTYGSWTAGEEPYIVSVRLRLQELDQRVAKRPNVLFILTDDQAPTAVGVENHGELRTPHIDRIFQEGVWLKKSFVTTPVCSPSRAALLTSRFGTELGITDWIDPQSEPERGLSPDWVTWPKLFQQAGYRTGLVGKWHLGTQDKFHPTQFGYEYFMGFREGGNTPVDPTLEKEGKTQKFDGYTPDVLTDHAIDFLRQSSEQPFLLSVHYRAPHAAWLPVRDEDWNRYKDLAPTLPETESAPLDVERVQKMTREYYASIASVDRNVGRLLELLDQLKLADDTIVIFTSDHGYNMGHHGLWYKGNARWVTKTIPPQQWTDIERQSRPNLYDQSMRVPTAIRWPNQLQPGTQIDRVVTHLDWFPTLLAMAGIDRPAGLALRGRDMLPLLKGETRTWDDELYAEYNMKHGATTAMRCVRTPQWKLVKDFANPGRDELYDLIADPDEHHNLVAANLPRVSQAREQLTSQLIRFMEQRHDPAVVLARLQSGDVPAQPAQRWWKGNLHTHSFWSDGNDFPEMIAQWYVDRGYNFLALSDHNVLSQGKRWLPADTIKQRGGEDVIDKYLQRFGRDWVEQRVNSETSNDEVRLKPLSEFRSLVEVRGRFMMVQSEEISDSVAGKPVHMNAANLIEPIPPVGGSTVREAISNNLRAAQEQADRLGQEILVHLNHPNFGYAITAEDLAHVIQEQFFEVFNGHDAINHLGDATHPGDEKIWDIANTIRIGQLHAPPLYGLGTDDSHHYHGRGMSRPGRSWVMVRARHLTPESLILAMRAGEFYASSGVSLDEVRFDETTHTLTVDVAAEPGIGYAIEFIGTPRDVLASSAEVTAAAEANPEPDPRIGSVLARVEGEQASYTLSGNELYVRAVVTSTSRHPDPTFANQYQQAWTQPVGWQTQPLQSARE